MAAGGRCGHDVAAHLRVVAMLAGGLMEDLLASKRGPAEAVDDHSVHMRSPMQGAATGWTKHTILMPGCSKVDWIVQAPSATQPAAFNVRTVCDRW